MSINTRFSRGPTQKQVSDALNPFKYIYTPEEIANGNWKSADAREEEVKWKKIERLLQLLDNQEVLSCLNVKDDNHRQVHLHDRQLEEVKWDDIGLQHNSQSARPATG
jgi:hypothetical protein